MNKSSLFQQMAAISCSHASIARHAADSGIDTTQPKSSGARFYVWVDRDGDERSGWFMPGIPPAHATDCTGMNDDQFCEFITKRQEKS